MQAEDVLQVFCVPLCYPLRYFVVINKTLNHKGSRSSHKELKVFDINKTILLRKPHVGESNKYNTILHVILLGVLFLNTEGLISMLNDLFNKSENNRK
jgi:hypothetical protein